MERLQSVQHVIVILSGKGGVGKSTVAVQLALALRAKGKKVINIYIICLSCVYFINIYNTVTLMAVYSNYKDIQYNTIQ